MGAPHVQQSTVACVPGMRAFSPVATSTIVIAVLGSIAAVDICGAKSWVGIAYHMPADFQPQLKQKYQEKVASLEDPS
jgi:hypothetical protein